MDDDEFMNNEASRIFPIDELRTVIDFINRTLFQLYTREHSQSNS